MKRRQFLPTTLAGRLMRYDLRKKPFRSGIYCAKATLCSWSGLAFVKVTAARIGDTIRRDAAAHCR
ncbi:hypothetical protein [Rhizobium leguminosarum]|jgi:hypothetical protein|uniref:hypothetical protein n=1 Tax=Rhizobium leguminosarum TaxID=384 RepID=UPI0024B3AFEE|nr:hypothetical protein [Rhizobium leguminosarum]WHO82906.1 hypothetical protein QMO81_005806 [Rhizobium leguminosarum]